MGSMGHGGMSGGMRTADGPARGTGRAVGADLTKKRPKPPLKKVLPEVWKLVKPRRWLIGGSFLLMVVNRLCGFVLPISSAPFINHVLYQHRMGELKYIIASVAGAVKLDGQGGAFAGMEAFLEVEEGVLVEGGQFPGMGGAEEAGIVAPGRDVVEKEVAVGHEDGAIDQIDMAEVGEDGVVVAIDENGMGAGGLATLAHEL